MSNYEKAKEFFAKRNPIGQKKANAYDCAFVAVSRMIPEKPWNNRQNSEGRCPECGTEYSAIHAPKFCPVCGQRLDWSDFRHINEVTF